MAFCIDPKMALWEGRPLGSVGSWGDPVSIASKHSKTSWLSRHLPAAVVGAFIGATAALLAAGGTGTPAAPAGGGSEEAAAEAKKAAPSDVAAVAPEAANRLDLTALERPGTVPATRLEMVKLDLTPAQVVRQTEIRKGDTLMQVMVKAGADRRQAHNAIGALAKVYDPRRLMPGQQLTLTFEAGAKRTAAGDALELVAVAFEVSAEREIVASRGEQGFAAEVVDKPLERRLHRASARIDDNLFLAAERSGVPAAVIIDLIHLYSFDVDFQRDIQPGDGFQVLYESFYDEKGALARQGDVLYAALRLGNVDLPLYRFRFKDGAVDYFNAKGHSVRKALMKTPVDGARLSSRYGRRRHPILGYNKMHRGVDFAAPRGTPVMAAGTGTIEVAGRNGAYGRYVRIRHNSEYKTAYAHLHRFARGARRGKRVRQGQIIGYVGSSGRSTGAHLHYEILKNGRQINPLSLKLPTGRKLKGKTLTAFLARRDQTRAAFAAAAPEEKIADGR